jgi:hypothetical protein
MAGRRAAHQAREAGELVVPGRVRAKGCWGVVYNLTFPPPSDSGMQTSTSIASQSDAMLFRFTVLVGADSRLTSPFRGLADLGSPVPARFRPHFPAPTVTKPSHW